jgi:hypothetical protein
VTDGRGDPAAESLDPAAVPELAAWIERYGAVTLRADLPELIEGAKRALRAALSGESRSRETAFALLAADGLITSVVERLAESPEPAEAFRVLLDRVAQGATGGSA